MANLNRKIENDDVSEMDKLMQLYCNKIISRDDFLERLNKLHNERMKYYVKGNLLRLAFHRLICEDSWPYF